jgi:hypothetical protein
LDGKYENVQNFKGCVFPYTLLLVDNHLRDVEYRKYCFFYGRYTMPYALRLSPREETPSFSQCHLLIRRFELFASVKIYGKSKQATMGITDAALALRLLWYAGLANYFAFAKYIAYFV